MVFESGMGASCLSWTLVQSQVAQFTRAVSYDRDGHGWSDPAREPRSAQQIAQELHVLLDAASVSGPFVLVGHSFGGYVNRAFAQLYRNEVAGMVLVDSVHPAEWRIRTESSYTDGITEANNSVASDDVASVSVNHKRWNFRDGSDVRSKSRPATA